MTRGEKITTLLNEEGMSKTHLETDGSDVEIDPSDAASQTEEVPLVGAQKIRAQIPRGGSPTPEVAAVNGREASEKKSKYKAKRGEDGEKLKQEYILNLENFDQIDVETTSGCKKIKPILARWSVTMSKLFLSELPVVVNVYHELEKTEKDQCLNMMRTLDSALKNCSRDVKKAHPDWSGRGEHDKTWKELKVEEEGSDAIGRFFTFWQEKLRMLPQNLAYVAQDTDENGVASREALSLIQGPVSSALREMNSSQTPGADTKRNRKKGDAGVRATVFAQEPTREGDASDEPKKRKTREKAIPEESPKRRKRGSRGTTSSSSATKIKPRETGSVELTFQELDGLTQNALEATKRYRVYDDSDEHMVRLAAHDALESFMRNKDYITYVAKGHFKNTLHKWLLNQLSRRTYDTTSHDDITETLTTLVEAVKGKTLADDSGASASSNLDWPALCQYWFYQSLNEVMTKGKTNVILALLKEMTSMIKSPGLRVTSKSKRDLNSA
jgi:hypothetical protein